MSVSSDVASLSAPERLAGELENEIIARHLSAGARVALRAELIDRFGVSGGTVNEALRILRERGVVTVKPGVRGGVFVAQAPPQVRLGAIDLWFRDNGVDPLELFEARSTLEDSLAAVAALRATPEDLRDLAWALEEMRNSADDALGYFEANMRFHSVVVRAARITVLAGMYDVLASTLRASVVRAAFAATDAAEIIAHNLDVHAALMTAIRDGNQELLAETLQKHRIDLVRVPDRTRSPGQRSGRPPAHAPSGA